MSDETHDADGGSVFGNLPGSRPGSRSPRRDSARRSASAKDGGASKRKPKAKAAAGEPAARRPRPKARPAPKPTPARPQPEPSQPTAAEPGAPASGGGLDDLAWAGVAAAAEAATFGVRLANRALEALRGAAERR